MNSTITNIYQYKNVQNYIKELELSQGHLGSCIKIIYGNEQKNEFMKHLEDTIKHYNSGIEKLCNKNYKSFIESFNELLNFRVDIANFKESLINNNDKIQIIGHALVDKYNELTKEIKKHNNILLTIDALNNCLPVFEICRKLNEYMEQKQHYLAIKSINELENSHLPLIKHYRFSYAIENSILNYKKQIEIESLSELKKFLETLRVDSVLVGKVASFQMANKNKIDLKFCLLENEINLADENTNKIIEDYTLKMPLDCVDFSALYRTLHMNKILNTRNSFSSYYRTQRKKQLKLTLEFPLNMEFEIGNQSINLSLDIYKRYFHGVTGFFVIEEQVMSNTEGLIDERYLDELTNIAMPKLILFIQKAMSNCKDAEFMLQVKTIVVLFCDTLDDAQFPTTQLSDLLKEIRDMYYNMILEKWDLKIKEILKNDNYDPVEIFSEKDYDELFEQFPCRLLNANKNQDAYPKRMPFSLSVPKIFVEIKEFINICVKFADGLNSSQTELDEMIRKPTNKLISEKLKDSIYSHLHHVELRNLVQIVVNIICLQRSIYALEEYFLTAIKATNSKQSGKLQGISILKDLKSEAESIIYEQLNARIDSLLDLESFNWTARKSTGQPSDCMSELFLFLKNIFDSINQLQSKLAQTACISACKYISQTIMQEMMRPEVKTISLGAFEQINLNLVQCETFAREIQIHGLDNDIIMLCFTELRQLIDLILSKEWSLYLKDLGKTNNKYNRVQANTALILLEKLREDLKKSKGFLLSFGIGSKSQQKNDDKILLDMVSKQLKSIIANSYNAN